MKGEKLDKGSSKASHTPNKLFQSKRTGETNLNPQQKCVRSNENQNELHQGKGSAKGKTQAFRKKGKAL
jgi:hypothetical protein